LVECSKGTYIRALARDLGEELGSGAHLARLTRLSSGRYTLEDAIPLSEAERLLSTGRGREILHPLDEALLRFEAFRLDEESVERVRQGQPVEGPQPTQGPLSRAYGPDGRLIALLRYDRERTIWQPRKVFRPHAANA
ncbi:MAG TPA: tRNA pseudouridine(55) synthase TruB, partial [Chloroflexi bacterium]|nr:tRNA pseudouridine(55) synthase TruB [Chloroflexota bacterium]